MSISPSSGEGSRKRGRGQMDDAPRDASGRRIFTVEIDGREYVFSGSSEPPRPAVYRIVPPSLALAPVDLDEEDPERSEQEDDEEPSDIVSSKRARVPASSKAIQGLREARPGDEGMPADCAVCLQDLDADDKLRAMPCSHAFHQRCIFEWLRRNGVCPLCRRAMTRKMISSCRARRCRRRSRH